MNAAATTDNCRIFTKSSGRKLYPKTPESPMIADRTIIYTRQMVSMLLAFISVADAVQFQFQQSRDLIPGAEDAVCTPRREHPIQVVPE